MWSNVLPKPLVIILLGALALRVSAAFVLQDRLDNHLHRRFLIEGDSNGYWELGENIAAGRAYSIYDPPRQILRMPGLPALLGASMKLANAIGLPEQRFLVARLVLAIVGTVACALVYCLGLQLFDRRTGLIAASISACMPSLVAFSVILLSETLFAACMVFSLCLMARLVWPEIARAASNAPQPAIACGADVGRSRGICLSLVSLGVGVSVAAACYARPTWLLVGPMFAFLYLLTAQRKALAAIRGVLILVALLACLAPWAARNHRVTGHWVLTTLWVGPSLYDGLNPSATGDSDMEFFEKDRKTNPEVAGLGEYEIDRYYRKQAREFVIKNPRRALELTAIKLWRFWKPWPNAAQFGGAWQRLAVGGGFIPAALLALYGWWTHRRRFWAWALTLGPLLYFAAVHAVFVASLRYRLPAEYPLYVLSAAGLAALWDRFHGARPPRGENLAAQT